MAEAIDQPVDRCKCDATLDEPAGTPVENRVPCPSCGSRNRALVRRLTTEIGLSAHLSALQERQGEVISFSESERQGLARGASLGDDGVDMVLVGPSPQGEQDTKATCERLRERLNLDGASWTYVREGKEEPADCELVDAGNGEKTLKVQVVRAIVSHELWRDLNSRKSATRSLSPAKAVDEVRAAIKKKANDRRIPGNVRSQLVLALDATRLPGLAFDAIMREFRTKNMAWTASLGFAAVWLVGSELRLVWRLDSYSL